MVLRGLGENNRITGGHTAAQSYQASKSALMLRDLGENNAMDGSLGPV